jgi:hypothetical protein
MKMITMIMIIIMMRKTTTNHSLPMTATISMELEIWSIRLRELRGILQPVHLSVDTAVDVDIDNPYNPLIYH